MARGYLVFGEFMVYVKGLAGTFPIFYQPLGLTSEPVNVRPRYMFKDIKIDDFGPDIPVDTMTMMMDCSVQMTLINFDDSVLQACMAMVSGVDAEEGICGPAGVPLGGKAARYTDRNRFATVYLQPTTDKEAVGVKPWRFLNCYLDGNPLEIPLGTECSKIRLNWRALPYVLPDSLGEIFSSDNVTVFDHVVETSFTV